jgi:hypothetical protein
MAKDDLARDKKRDIAESLYLTTDMTQKEICEMVGWAENTFSANKAKYKWEEKKGAQRAGAHQIITNIYMKLAELSEQDALKYAKEMAMLAGVIEKIKGRTLTPTNYIEVFKEITVFIMLREPKLAQALNAHMKAFFEEKLKGGVI